MARPTSGKAFDVREPRLAAARPACRLATAPEDLSFSRRPRAAAKPASVSSIAMARATSDPRSDRWSRPPECS
jgi:hypothetical protein